MGISCTNFSSIREGIDFLMVKVKLKMEREELRASWFFITQPMRLNHVVQAHRLPCGQFLRASEMRLQGGSTGEIRGERFDIVWLRRVNLEND
jgi:hypothetical protein